MKLKKTFKLNCQQQVLKIPCSNYKKIVLYWKKDFLYIFGSGQTVDLVPHSASNLLSVILFLRGALDPGKEKAIVQVNFSGYSLAAPC